MAKLSGWLLFTPERPMIAMYKMARSFQPSFTFATKLLPIPTDKVKQIAEAIKSAG